MRTFCHRRRYYRHYPLQRLLFSILYSFSTQQWMIIIKEEVEGGVQDLVS